MFIKFEIIKKSIPDYMFTTDNLSLFRPCTHRLLSVDTHLDDHCQVLPHNPDFLRGCSNSVTDTADR